METSDLQRHQTIKRLTTQPTDKVADAAIFLWEQMAIHIIAIVGDGGFNALYARSLFLTKPHHPWLTGRAQAVQTGSWLEELKNDFEGKTPAQIREANALLLKTFTDILVSLIGEPLTTRILNSAWSDIAQDGITKEFKNE